MLFTHEFDTLDKDLCSLHINHDMLYKKEGNQHFYILQLPKGLEVRLPDNENAEPEMFLVSTTPFMFTIAKAHYAKELLGKVLANIKHFNTSEE